MTNGVVGLDQRAHGGEPLKQILRRQGMNGTTSPEPYPEPGETWLQPFVQKCMKESTF